MRSHEWDHEPINTGNPWVFRIGISVAFLIAILLMAIFGHFQMDWISHLAGR
ncbi:MAG: hypothetical protein R3A46_21285 [Thermomicrobiales bacterium]